MSWPLGRAAFQTHLAISWESGRNPGMDRGKHVPPTGCGHSQPDVPCLPVMLWQGLENKAFQIIPEISACKRQRHTTHASEGRGNALWQLQWDLKNKSKKTPKQQQQQKKPTTQPSNVFKGSFGRWNLTLKIRPLHLAAPECETYACFQPSECTSWNVFLFLIFIYKTQFITGFICSIRLFSSQKGFLLLASMGLWGWRIIWFCGQLLAIVRDY